MQRPEPLDADDTEAARRNLLHRMRTHRTKADNGNVVFGGHRHRQASPRLLSMQPRHELLEPLGFEFAENLVLRAFGLDQPLMHEDDAV